MTGSALHHSCLPQRATLARALASFAIVATIIISVPAFAEQAKPMRKGDILTGELTAMKSKRTKTVTYQIKSDPRRLPEPSGLCNLETGPETFELVTNNAAEAQALKVFLGKTIAVKVAEVACAQDAGEYNDAVVSKWSVVAQ